MRGGEEEEEGGERSWGVLLFLFLCIFMTVVAPSGESTASPWENELFCS